MTTHLSQAAYDRLEEELAFRSGDRRRQISEWIERARELGDLKENADYHAAKDEQGHNEARVRQLEAILKDAEIVAAADADVVSPGTVVEVRMDGDDDTITYLVGSIEERHDEYDVLSVTSPLGQAVMGKAVGDSVDYEGPKRTFQVEIVSVRPL
ncbi:MAG: transcription elongation factor GreA [Acidimicrobiia bacterium]